MNPEQAVQHIATIIAEHGGRALLAGGCVRDALLGLPRKDFDVEVYGVTGDDLWRLLDSDFELIDVGRAFGVIKIKGLPIDVSLPRRETKVAAGHRGFDIDTDPDLDLAEAARRRDLTVNALYEDPLTGEILDPMNGRPDLERRVLRHCSDRFAEDPLRVLRIMQFAARLDFDVHPDTVALAGTLDLSELPRERIEVEWRKLLLQGVRPSRGLQFLADSNAIRFFPEIDALRGTEQNPEWHPEGDVFVHTQHCLDHFAANRTGDDDADWRVGLGILCHDLGKPPTTVLQDGVWRSIGHDIAGEAPTRSFLARLTAETDVVECVVALVKLHLRPFEFARVEAGDAAIRRLATQVDLRLLVRVAHSDHAGRPPRPDDGFPPGRWLLERAHALAVADGAPKPLILGRHLIELGEKPGPHFGELLERCFAAQLDGEFRDLEGGKAFLKQLLEHG